VNDDHGFKYRLLPYIGSIVLGFKVPNTVLSADIGADMIDIDTKNYWMILKLKS